MTLRDKVLADKDSFTVVMTVLEVLKGHIAARSARIDFGGLAPNEIKSGYDKRAERFGKGVFYPTYLQRHTKEEDYFQEVEAGTILGYVKGGRSPCLQAFNEMGKDVAEQYFSSEKGILRFSVPLMPSMITLDEQIIRQDCLCYLMERLDYRKLKQE